MKHPKHPCLVQASSGWEGEGSASMVLPHFFFEVVQARLPLCLLSAPISYVPSVFVSRLDTAHQLGSPFPTLWAT